MDQNENKNLESVAEKAKYSQTKTKKKSMMHLEKLQAIIKIHYSKKSSLVYLSHLQSSHC